MPATPPTKRTQAAWLWATFFGCGFLRPGPGTYGSVAAALLWLLAFHVLPCPSGTRSALTLLAAVLVTLLGIPAATRVAREAGNKDPGFVVIDEVAGQLLALTLLAPSWRGFFLGLLLFRAFDIAKPWPIRRLEALPEGTGIMLDDVAAGLLAALVGVFLLHVFPHWR